MTTRRRPIHYWRNLALFALLSAVVATMLLCYVGHPYYLSRGWSHPARLPVCCATPADRGLAYEEVAFTTADGLTLRGWYVPSRNGAAVVLAHGLAGNRVALLDHAAMLARHGYGALLLDLRCHGESDGDVLPFGGNEAEDIVAAARYLQARPDVDPTRVAALGLSLGGQVSILAAARSDALRAVIADGPCCTTFSDMPPPATVSDWLWVPYDLVFFQMLRHQTGVADPTPVHDALAHLASRPVLLIDGGAGRIVVHLARAAGNPPGVETWLIPDAGHIDGLARHPAEYEQHVIDFLDRALASP